MGKIIGILLGIIIIGSLVIWFNSKQQKTTKNTSGQKPNDPPTPKQTSKPEKKYSGGRFKSFMGGVATFALGIALIALAIWAVIAVGRFVLDLLKPAEYELAIESQMTIQYAENYESGITLPPGKTISFGGATTAYCVKNLNNNEVCGERGQNVASALPGGNANTVLWFKSNDGNKGQITIFFLKKVRKK